MTEKRLKPDNKAQFIVKRVGFQYNVNKNSIEYDGKHFAYCNVEQNKIANKLTALEEENEQLQARNDRQAKQLDRLYQLISQKDWRTLKTDIMDDFKKTEEQLQREWRTYE